jgi:Cu2+-exporting ATPase
MEHQHHPEKPAITTKMDHSKMDHSIMQHGHNPSMGMEGHNHAMMIADFKKRFYFSVPMTPQATLGPAFPEG